MLLRRESLSELSSAAGRSRTSDQRVSACLTASAPRCLRVRCSTTELSSALLAYTAASVPVRRRRAISFWVFIYSPDCCGVCHEPQNAHLRTPSGISDPHDMQFASFSSSNGGSQFCVRAFLARQTQAASIASAKQTASTATVKGESIGIAQTPS